MKFKVFSPYFYELNDPRDLDYTYKDSDYNKGINKYLKLLKPYTFIEDNSLCMEINSIEELNNIVEKVHNGFEEIEEHNGCWAPDSVIIDFKNKEITFRDYYLE